MPGAGRRLMVVQDGEIVEVRGHHSDQAALDAFFGTLIPHQPSRGAGGPVVVER